MLYNISNHPSSEWNESQLAAARQLAGEVVDIEFPKISPYDSSEDIASLAQNFAITIAQKMDPEHDIAHVMGEHTFCFMLVNTLLSIGIRCVASTTNRVVNYTIEGDKISQFDFVAFRDYTSLT